MNVDAITITLNDSALPLPSHRQYRPLSGDAVGTVGRILTDLNVSIREPIHDLKRRRMTTRYYSVKTRSDRGWRLQGHTPRILLREAELMVQERARRLVVQAGAKSPHAFVQGRIGFIDSGDNHAHHLALLKTLFESGGRFVAYCPYRTAQFVWHTNRFLPDCVRRCQELVPVSYVRQLYAFENGMVAL